MFFLSTPSLTSLFTAVSAPGVPPEVQQLANELSKQTQDLFTQFIEYGVLMAGLMAAFALLFGSLSLILDKPVLPPVSFESRPASPALPRPVRLHRYPRRPSENPVARANRQALQLASARIRAGQFGN
jgi:hypothetical protein